MDKHYKNPKQICNYYRRRLIRAIEDNYSQKDFNQIAKLIDIYSVESEKEYLYLPNKKIRVRGISEILYYEALFGKKIYKKTDYKICD